MIRQEEIISIGTFLKPHGIKGEVAVELSADVDVSALTCIVVDVDGIFVPFFVDSVRVKSADIDLLTIEGVRSDAEAKEFTGKTLYALRSDLDLEGDYEDDGNLYAEDLVGFKVVDSDSGDKLGEVSDYDDRTENVVLIVSRPDSGEFYIPFVDEFFAGIDFENKVLEVSLPEGLLNM